MKIQLQNKDGSSNNIAQPIQVISGKFTRALCQLIEWYQQSGYHGMSCHCELTSEELEQILGSDLASYTDNALKTKMSKGRFQWHDEKTFVYSESVPE